MAGKCSNGKCNDFDGDKDNAEIYEVQVRARAALGMLALTLFLMETAKLFSWRKGGPLKKSICLSLQRYVCVCVCVCVYWFTLRCVDQISSQG